MIKTYGLSHLNLAVRDLDRAVQFYAQAFGARECGQASFTEDSRSSRSLVSSQAVSAASSSRLLVA